MSARASLLLELGCEELPPRALDDLAAAFAASLRASLEQAGLIAADAPVQVFSTPRRLAVHVAQVAGAQAEQHVERRGPAVSAGLDAGGQPTRALLGFARSCGVEPAALERLETPKGTWFVHRAVQPGQALGALLPGMLAAAVKALPIPRPMRWGDHDHAFVRPVHWLVALHGEAVIDVELLGVRSGRQSRGHRFHHPEPVAVSGADAWQEALRAAQVIVDPAERRRRIVAGCQRIAQDKGLRLAALNEAALLRELVNITEWPVPILCRFDAVYLELPSEVLRTTMEVDQRFIATAPADAPDRLSPWFFGIANIDSREPEQIRRGYERVIRPRFADARFFYEEDLKTPLAAHQEALAGVTYQEALGSVWDKCLRVAELARVIANRAGVDAGLATHAASLAKCDLVTRMVGEFPDLQGVMGLYYARAQGEPEAVALALEGVYRPRHAGEPIAAEPLSRVLAVAERVDTLAGIFAVGLRPTGSKDPFALRRAAQGLARTLIEGELDLDLEALFIEALELLPDAALTAGARSAAADAPQTPAARRRTLRAELPAFVRDRLRGYYAEQGFSAEEFASVEAVAPRSLLDFDRRLRAVAEFARLPQARSLASANKRVGNLLQKKGEGSATAFAPALLQETAEQALAAALDAHGAESEARCRAGDYAAALRALAVLQPEVDRFFDEVLVMSEDAALRANRLALLARLQARFMAVADIACLHV